MTHGSLFSGIGGAELAASWMGWNNMFHCEINPFGRKILNYWFPESKSYEDIKKTDFKEWKGRIDILTGGFPCQPFSLAGKRKGAEDDRYLWPEMLRVIRETQPTWIVSENVAGIVSMVQPGKEIEMAGETSLFEENYYTNEEQEYVIETICKSLEDEGYSVQPVIIPACAVGAPHRRDRVWFIAYRTDSGNKNMQEWKNRIHESGFITNSNSIGSYRESSDSNRKNNNSKVGDIHGEIDGFRIERTIANTENNGFPFSRETRKRRDGFENKTSSYASNERLQGEMSRNSKLSPECIGYASDSNGKRLRREINRNGESKQLDKNYQKNDWSNFPTQSPVCDRNDGLSDRLVSISFSKWRCEAIKAMGNSWVPQVAYEIFKIIDSIENESKKD